MADGTSWSDPFPGVPLSVPSRQRSGQGVVFYSLCRQDVDRQVLDRGTPLPFGQTNKLSTLPSLVLRTQAVKQNSESLFLSLTAIFSLTYHHRISWMMGIITLNLSFLLYEGKLKRNQKFVCDAQYFSPSKMSCSLEVEVISDLQLLLTRKQTFTPPPGYMYHVITVCTLHCTTLLSLRNEK